MSNSSRTLGSSSKMKANVIITLKLNKEVLYYGIQVSQDLHVFLQERYITGILYFAVSTWFQPGACLEIA